jgi:hypothetical protein
VNAEPTLARRAEGKAAAAAREQDGPPAHLLPEPSPAELALAQERAEAFAQLEPRDAPIIPLRPAKPTAPHAQPREPLTLTEAARYARCVKPDGRPRDRFYNTIKEELGPRRVVFRDELDDLIKGGRL